MSPVLPRSPTAIDARVGKGGGVYIPAFMFHNGVASNGSSSVIVSIAFSQRSRPWWRQALNGDRPAVREAMRWHEMESAVAPLLDGILSPTPGAVGGLKFFNVTIECSAQRCPSPRHDALPEPWLPDVKQWVGYSDVGVVQVTGVGTLRELHAFQELVARKWYLGRSVHDIAIWYMWGNGDCADVYPWDAHSRDLLLCVIRGSLAHVVAHRRSVQKLALNYGDCAFVPRGARSGRYRGAGSATGDAVVVELHLR